MWIKGSPDTPGARTSLNFPFLLSQGERRNILNYEVAGRAQN